MHFLITCQLRYDLIKERDKKGKKIKSKIRIMNIKLLFFLSLPIFLFNPPLLALEQHFFFTQNQSPLTQIYGLPSLGNAHLLPPGKGELRLTLDYASNYIADAHEGETIILDGESARFTFSGRYGIKKDWEVGLEIPFLLMGGGFLDNFIINYHSTFGFPQGGRDRAPRDRLLYQYKKDGQEKLRTTGASAGLGDIRLYSAWQLYQKKRLSLLSHFFGN